MFVGFTKFCNEYWVSFHEKPYSRDAHGHQINWEPQALVTRIDLLTKSSCGHVILQGIEEEVWDLVFVPFALKSTLVLRNYMKYLLSIQRPGECGLLGQKIDTLSTYLKYRDLRECGIDVPELECSMHNMRAQLLRLDVRLRSIGETLCCVCLSAPKTRVMVPCGHMCVCSECDTKIVDRKCPLCRRGVLLSCEVFA